MPNFRVKKGIALTSLVATVIVILILATISLYMMTGDNNLIFRTGKAKEESERVELEEVLNAAYVKLERKSKYNSVANLDDAVEDVKTKGYEDKIVGLPSDGYELCGEDVTLTKVAPNNTKTITIKKDTSENSDGIWYAVIMGKYFKIEDNNGTVKIAKEPSNVEMDGHSIGDAINITNNDVTIANADIATFEVIEGDKLKVTALNEGSSVITIKSNGKTATCKVTVIAGNIAIPTASNKTYTGVKQTGVAGGTGYSVTDGEKIDAGTYTAKAVLTDKTNTTWSDGTTTDKNIEWKISPYNLSQSTIENVGTQEFTGNAITPEPDATVPIPSGNTTKLVKGRDFTYSYTNNTAKGTATVTITGKGNYTGTKSATYEIAPTLVKVTSSDYNKVYDGNNHGITLTVTEPTSGCTVYYKEGTTALTKDNYTTGSTTKIEKKDAGTYTIQWYVHTTDNNYSDRSGSNKIIITQKQSTASVEITGTNTQGQKLTAVPTTNGDGTKKYQWFSNTTNSTTGGTKLTESTTSAEYTVGTGLVGKYIYVVLTVEAGTNYKSSNASDITDDENNITGKSAYVVTYEKGANVTAIGATTAKTTTGKVTLPNITAQDGYTAPGWYNGNTKVGNAGEEVTITGNVTLTAKAEDKTKPDATLTSTNTLKQTKQTATLSATDGVGVTAYYWGTSSPTSSSTYTTVTSTKNFSITKDITAAGTYYFAAKDDAGNTSEIKSVTIQSYVVYNMLDKVEGTQGTYTTAHYDQKSKYTYVAPKGTTITATSVYTAPETKGITYKGMASVAPSTTAASVATTASVALNSNLNLSYWWNRNTYTVAYNSNNGSGTMSTDSVKYKQDYVAKANTFTKEGYTWKDWNEKADGTGTKWGSWVGKAWNWTYTKNITLYAQWTYIATPTITRSDYNTFTVSAAGGSKYIISKELTTVPTASTTGWTTTTSQDTSTSAKETWYVWVQDSNGNISPNYATITNYKVTLTEGTGTTLTAKADTTSGATVTSGMYVLDKTPVYPTGTLNSGYRALVIKKGSTEITSGSKQTIGEDTTFTTSATANKVTITINADGAAWNNSGIKVELRNGDTVLSKTVTGTNVYTAEFSSVANGTYDVYSGKNSGDKTILIDSGLDITVSDNDKTGTLNYYSLTLAKGTGISGTNQTGYTSTGKRYYLYKSSGTQQNINIDATVKAGYTWDKWTKTGTDLTTFTAGTKSQNVIIGQGATTLTANATLDEYTISYTLNGGTNGTGNPTSYTIESNDITLADASKTGYTFTGWTTDGVTTPTKGLKITKGSTGNKTFTANFTINDPSTPTISGAATKIYGAADVTLTAATTTTYASGTTLYYSFGYATKDGGTPGNWTEASTSATYKVGKSAYVGDRYWSCRVYATDGTQTSNTVASATSADALVRHNNATLTFDVTTNGGTLSGIGTLYTRTGSTGVYTGIRNSTAGTIPTATKEGYTFNGWYTAATNGSKVLNADGTFTGTAVSGYSTADKKWATTTNKTLYAQWTYIETPTITRSDYNTFTVSAAGGSKYIISKTQKTLPTASTSGWTTTTSKDTSTSEKETWYVWVQDENGNISPNHATITNYAVTLTAGEGTTLTAKADTTSGATVTSGMYVLDKTPVYPNASKNTGYHALVIKKGSTEITSGSKQTIGEDTTFTTSATANKVTITINADGAAWKNSGIKVELRNGDTVLSKTVTGTNVYTAEFSPVENGTYDVYAGKHSGDKTTLIDSGLDITVSDNDKTGTLNYYSLKLVKGTGISETNQTGYTSTGKRNYLYKSSGTQQDISIDATESEGYTWSTWTKTSGTNLATFTAETKSQSVKMGAGPATLTAYATYTETPRITRNDYNTFEVSTACGSKYIMSTTQTEVPTASTTGWKETTTQDASTSAKETWYVWVQDEDGNISPNSATITNYKVTLSVGTGTTLTAKADTTTGDDVTNEMYVLNGTPIYPTGALIDGYNTLVLKKDSSTITNESEQIISENTTITSSATSNTYTISYDYADGTAGTNAPTSGTYDADVQISNPTRTGYIFGGWTSSSSNGLGANAKTGTKANPSTAWTGTATTNTYFKNLTDTNNGTVKLTATWKANYKLRKVIGTSNLIANGGFDNYSLVDAPAKAANGVTHTWDKALNGVPNNTSKAYKMTSWDEYANGTGANMGAVVPEIGYHAHMRIVNGNNVLRFKTNEAYAGKTAANVSGGVSVTPGTIDANRWLGVSQQLTGTNLTAGATYVVTLDAYRVSGTQNITGGLYYATNSNTERGFRSGQYSFNPTKTGEWETFSWTFTLSSDYLNTTNPSLYVYGCLDGTGEVYVDNVRLERYDNTQEITKEYDSLYTTEELNTPSRSGYSFDGWYSDARYTKRIDESEKFNINTATFEDVDTPNTPAYIYAKWSYNSYTIAFNKNNPNAIGTMQPMTASRGTAITLNGNTFTVPAGIATKQIFNGWNTKADGTGTKYLDKTSVTDLSTTGETVTLYAQWIDALYEVDSPSKYTVSMQDAITSANANANIKVIRDGADNLTANVNKTLTLNLNGKTLTRSGEITVSQGNFTVQGSGTLVSSGKGIYNSGSDSTIKITNYALIRSANTSIEFKADGRNYSGTLDIQNSWIYTTGNAIAILIGSANNVTINNSWVYMPYASNHTVHVNYELPQMTISGVSRIGSGYIGNSNNSALMYFGSGSNGLTLDILDKSILMAGQYNYSTISLDRTANVNVKDEAELYALRDNTATKCIDCQTSNSSITCETYGWVYSMGNNVVNSNANSPVKLNRGTYVARTQKMVSYTDDFNTNGGLYPHQFYYMKEYNNISLSDGKSLYEFGRGWAKVGNTFNFGWRFYWSDGTLATGLNKIGSSYYYFNDNHIMQTGWVHNTGNDSWYYFKPKSGTTGGEAYTGGPYTLDGKKYIFGSDGKMLTGWAKGSDGYWYYLNPTETSSYKLGEALKGWRSISGAWYYMNGDYRMITGGPHTLGGEKYIFGSDGKMLTGWQQVGGKWYYLNPSDGKAKKGWIQVSGKWFYMNSDCTMKTGMHWEGTKRYCLSPKSGFTNQDGKSFQLGEMLTGLCIVDGVKYYFNPETGVSQ